jgi:RNA polymerase sigma-70 factor (ECF subfamily)
MKEPTRLTLVTTESPAVSPSLELRSDDELMLLARGGSSAAFDTLVRRHQQRVLSVAARRLGRPALAADVAQNAFIEVYRALPRYRARGRFRAFLYQILLNQCRMLERSHRIEARVLETVTDVHPLPPEDEILAREWRREVEVALGGLSHKLRDVILLRYSADLGYAEIAEALRVPVGTVKRRLFDGLAQLRERVERRA